MNDFLQAISKTKEWLLDDYGEKNSTGKTFHCVNPDCQKSIPVADCNDAAATWHTKCGSKKRCPDCKELDNDLYGGVTSNPAARAEESWKKHFYQMFRPK